MSQLLQTIKLKALSSELTDNEFDQFLCSARRAKGREFILGSLCQEQQHPAPTADLLQIVSNIIEQREIQQQAGNPWTLDTLPKSFIGEIASNLNQKDYVRFSRANRAIYIGCNDPNRLLSLSFPRTSSLSFIRFDRYPHLQKLEISKSALPFAGGDGHIFGRLKFLHLRDFCKESDWLSIVQQNALNSPQLQLRRLCLHRATFSSAHIARQVFAKFNMLQHLHLTCTKLEGNVSIPRVLVTTSLPNLHSLTVHGSDALANAFLKYRGPDLYQLDLGQLGATHSLRFDELKKINFFRLQRLRIDHDVPLKIVQHIVKTSANLISACYTAKYLPEQGDNDHEEISQFINAMLTRKENVSDLCVETFGLEQLECTSKAIECALQTTRNSKRKLLRIGLVGFHSLEVNEAVVIISRMLNRLSLCNVDEYALFVQLFHVKDDKKERLIQDVKDLVDNLETVELVRSERCVFIIRNKRSRINSYKMWWEEGGPCESSSRVALIY